MSDWRIYHNPRCSKSCETLALLRERGIEPEVVEYLQEPPSAAELERLCRLLDREPQELVRRGEDLFRELGLADAEHDRQGWLQVLTAHPQLLQRPIVVHGEAARLGRPPKTALELCEL